MNSARLAIDGGRPVRDALLPYGRQLIDESDVDAVVRVLRSDWLTTGPIVSAFERAFADTTGATHAAAVANGTAALHAAAHAARVGAGAEVIVPAMTFAATANCVVYEGGVPVFADVDPATLLLTSDTAEEVAGPQTTAVIAVDFAGHACDYDTLRPFATRRNLTLLADACHALGGTYHGRPVGSLADISTFSLHPVKPITAGEGGVVTTNSEELAERVRSFRNHGMTSDAAERERVGSWFYEIVELGFNYRLTDIQCALAQSQLAKLAGWIARRRELAARYDALLGGMPLRPLETREGVGHAYHLYVVLLDLDRLTADRATIFAALRAEGIGVNVHYIPVHLHPFYRVRFGTGPGMCPVAEDAYERMLTLPLHVSMTDGDVDDVVHALEKVLGHYGV